MRTGLKSWGVTLAIATGAALGAAPLPAQEAEHDDSAYRFTGEFKLIDLTSRAREGDLGFAHEGDDTASSTLASLRLMLSDAGGTAVPWELHYQNVKLDARTPGPPPGSTGAERFRYKPLRWNLERPETDTGHPASAQTVTWYQEIDRASIGWKGSGWGLTAGRQPITWGAGRFWQPLDVFGAFAPTELEREFKPGVDALLLQAFPSAFSAISAAYVASPEDEPRVSDSAVLHAQTHFGESSEAALLAGTVRDEGVAGGSLETAWLDAGWRLEALQGHPPAGLGDDYLFAIAGVDRQFANGVLAALEWYHHSQGATRAEDLPRAAAGALYRRGFQKQLSRDVGGLLLQKDFTGLLNGSYTLLASRLEDDPVSLLHQAAFTYSIANEADAVFALITATGRGIGPLGLPRSEFGAVPDSLYLRLRFFF